jgi:hypothetical protein
MKPLNYIKVVKGSEKAFLRWIDEQEALKKVDRRTVKVDLKGCSAYLLSKIDGRLS